MSVTIWGAGAIGGVVGAWMARSGVDVTLVDRDEAHVRAIQRDGLFVDGVRGEFRVPARATLPDQVEGPLGLVFLAVKCQHTEEAMRRIIPHLTPDSAVVSLQNGLNEDVIGGLIGRERTIGCFINFAADWQAPGHVRHGGEHPIYVGELDGRQTTRVDEIQALLSHFTETIVTDNVWGYLWSKLAFASLLFATALVDAHVYEVVRSPLATPILAGLVREVMTVARRQGIQLERLEDFWPEEYDVADDRPAMERIARHYEGQLKTKTGIWRDLAVRRRRTEVDCQVGLAVQKGVAVGVDMPLNRRLIELIHELEDGRRSMIWENFDAFPRP